MSRNLYAFIDESGLPSHDEYMTVAACWCVSEYAPAPTLNESRIDLLQTLNGVGEISGDKTELKSKDISPTGLDTVFASLNRITNSDNTILDAPYPWEEDSLPVRFTTAGVDAEAARDVFSGFSSSLDTPRMVQSVLLVDVLSPLLLPSKIDTARYDDVRIILDSETWSNAKDIVSDVPKMSDFEYGITDSKKAPGIQFADLAAGVKRRDQTGDEFNSAIDELRSLGLE